MPFRNPGLIIARILRLIGNAGQKIEASIDGSGIPRIDFYTGSANEAAPGSIFPLADYPVPGQFALVLRGPDPTGSQDPAELLLGTVDTRLTNYNQGGILGLIHDFSGNSVEVGPSAFGGVSINGTAGGIQLDGNINMLGEGIKGLQGRRITNFDCGEVSDNTSNGDGTLNFAHNLGGPISDIFIVANRNAVANQLLSRFPASDTSTTFRCRIQNNDGTSPPNGTSISVSYIGVKIS